MLSMSSHQSNYECVDNNIVPSIFSLQFTIKYTVEVIKRIINHRIQIPKNIPMHEFTNARRIFFYQYTLNFNRKISLSTFTSYMYHVMFVSHKINTSLIPIKERLQILKQGNKFKLNIKSI